MRKYGPEAEKQQFVKEYQEAISSSAQLTVSQVKELVVDVMAGEFDEISSEEALSPIIGFIKKTLKNENIPFNWLTGDLVEEAFKGELFEDIVKCLPDEEIFEKWFLLNKIDWTIENRDRLQIEKGNNKEMIQDLITSFYVSRLPREYLEKDVPVIQKVSHIDVELRESKGKVECHITVKYENGYRFTGYSDVTRILELEGYIT